MIRLRSTHERRSTSLSGETRMTERSTKVPKVALLWFLLVSLVPNVTSFQTILPQLRLQSSNNRLMPLQYKDDDEGYSLGLRPSRRRSKTISKHQQTANTLNGSTAANTSQVVSMGIPENMPPQGTQLDVPTNSSSNLESHSVIDLALRQASETSSSTTNMFGMRRGNSKATRKPSLYTGKKWNETVSHRNPILDALSDMMRGHKDGNNTTKHGAGMKKRRNKHSGIDDRKNASLSSSSSANSTAAHDENPILSVLSDLMPGYKDENKTMAQNTIVKKHNIKDITAENLNATMSSSKTSSSSRKTSGNVTATHDENPIRSVLSDVMPGYKDENTTMDQTKKRQHTHNGADNRDVSLSSSKRDSTSGSTNSANETANEKNPKLSVISDMMPSYKDENKTKDQTAEKQDITVGHAASSLSSSNGANATAFSKKNPSLSVFSGLLLGTENSTNESQQVADSENDHEVDHDESATSTGNSTGSSKNPVLAALSRLMPTTKTKARDAHQAPVSEKLDDDRSHNVSSTSSANVTTARRKRNPVLSAFSRIMPGYRDKDKSKDSDGSLSDTSYKKRKGYNDRGARDKGVALWYRTNSTTLALPPASASGSGAMTSTAPYNNALVDKNPSEVITLGDLESFLVANRFVRERDLEAWTASLALDQKSKGKNPDEMSALDAAGALIADAHDKTEETSSTSSGVAFPQPSMLCVKDLKYGTTLSSGLFGLLLAASFLPNMWLVGSIVGGLYGYDLVSKIGAVAADDEEPTSIVPRLLLRSGRWLAKTSLKIYDSIVILWFLYKTGQLSYEYFKRYEALDQRFAIQDKIDKWNSVFVKGKIAFDEWEQENEIGRKVVASLRTAWLVEEQSLKKAERERRSKYRVVQVLYDGLDNVKRTLRSMWLTVTGRGDSQFFEFLEGLRVRVAESCRLDELARRSGPIFAALIILNMAGALFKLSPIVLSVFAVFAGITWPSWWSEFVDRLSEFADETRARGRRELDEEPDRGVSQSLSSSSGSLLPPKFDKREYAYYIREDGSRRYYLKGKPWFFGKPREPEKKSIWPWKSGKDQEGSVGWSWPW
ncbi:hypothetical protein MPSEU_000548500 [Mayamaea pseudoterrestris]|nr:hypothetical protein MPSEU_000548500 [Mayamaea pseudoterrestris]